MSSAFLQRLNDETMREQNSPLYSRCGRGEHLERAATVGVGAVATAAGLGHGAVAAVLGAPKDIRRPGDRSRPRGHALDRGPTSSPAASATGGSHRRRKEGLRSWPLELPDHAACWFSAAWASVTPERVRVAAAASKTNARWLLGRLSVFLFVLELDGAVGSKHHTGLRTEQRLHLLLGLRHRPPPRAAVTLAGKSFCRQWRDSCGCDSASRCDCLRRMYRRE